MKISIFIVLILLSGRGFSMDILLTYFDPFDGKEINNSEIIAKKVNDQFQLSGVNLHLCKLKTVYDKAFLEIQDCISELKIAPSMVVSLGEAGCNGVKIETRAANFDQSKGPDNEGIERFKTAIYPGEPQFLGVTLPVEKAFCELSERQRKGVYISTDAGSFVCNNTLYHVLRNLSVPSTFIHVPTRKCTKGVDHEDMMSIIIQSMLKTFTKYPTGYSQPSEKWMAKDILKKELSSCERTFYSILKKEY